MTEQLSPLIASMLEAVQQHCSQALTLQRVERLHGGSISQSMALHCREGSFFAKVNDSRYAAMFAAECSGLAAMDATCSTRVPRPICQGSHADHAWLVLEYLPLSPNGDARAAGQQLATMHRHTAERFGFHEDNYIGLTPQPNTPDDDWQAFFRDQRLLPQFRRLAAKGMVDQALDQAFHALLYRLGDWLDDHRPVPSLLHGDLWSGNLAYAHGQPVIVDPACYYGDREADLAMSRLFGGFPPEYYRGYEEAWPLAAGSEQRIELYNLYHILNHANLFGRSYLHQAERMIRHLLSD